MTNHEDQNPDILEALTELAEATGGGLMPKCLAVGSVYERVGEWVTDPETGVSVGLGVNQWGTALSAIAAMAKAEIERLRLPSHIQVDEANDIITIYGIRYAGALFAHIGLGPIDATFKIIERKDGVVTVATMELPASIDPAGVRSEDGT